MRNVVAAKLEAGRFLDGPYGSDASYGLAGAFGLMGPKGEELRIVSSGTDQEFGWEHVSVSCKRKRTPNWYEMCFVKDLFWSDEEAVMQLHPPQSDYVNVHPHCLHLWRPLDAVIPLPPSILVGVRGKQ